MFHDVKLYHIEKYVRKKTVGEEARVGHWHTRKATVIIHTVLKPFSHVPLV